jgi:hypothetical protein
VELITIGSWSALRGDPSTFFGVFATLRFVSALTEGIPLSVCLLLSLQYRDLFQSSPHANSFVIGTAVINTHTHYSEQSVLSVYFEGHRAKPLTGLHSVCRLFIFMVMEPSPSLESRLFRDLENLHSKVRVRSPFRAVCVECLFLRTPSRAPYRDRTPPACAKRAAYPPPPPRSP